MGNLTICMILCVFLLSKQSSGRVVKTSEPSNREVLLTSLIHDVMGDSETEVVLLRDFVTSKSTSYLSELFSNSSSRWRDVVSLEWNKQVLPITDTLKEFHFSWLDRPWRVRQSNMVTLVVAVLMENFQAALEFAASTISLEPYYLKAMFWFPDARTAEDFDDLLLSPHASLFKYKVGVFLRDDTAVLRSVCFFCDKGEPEVLTESIYKPSTGFQGMPFADYTKNMHGKRIRGAFFYPFDPKKVREMQRNLQAVNFMDAYVTDVVMYLNADAYVEQYHIPPNATIDVEMPDGNWYGQLGDVAHERATFGVGTNVNGPAMKVVQWTHVYTFPVINYVTRKPRPKFGWYAIGQPFTPDMWIAIFTACCFGIVIFRAFLWLQSHFLNPFDPHPPPQMVWGYCLSYIFLPLMEENPPKVPTSHTARTFVAFWWAYSTIITCCYDTKLIGFLAAPELEDIPQSLRGMLDAPKWSLAMQDGILAFYTVFTQESEMEHHHQIRHRLQGTPTIQDCLQRALTEDTACVDLDAYLKPFSMFFVDKFGTYPFKLAEDENTFSLQASMSVQRHSVLAPTVRSIGLHIQGSGFFEKYSKDFPESCRMTGMKLSRISGLHYTTKKELVVEQLKGPLMLMVVFGWILPFFLFLKEIAERPG